jgi:two-component system, OmpR family, response regulator
MNCKAYIVEDSSTIRDNLIETLRELGQVEAIGTAETEHEGKRWLAQNGDAWDIAIVDLFLREGSGLNILQELQRKRRPGQRIVVLSNHSSKDVRWRCEQLGADAVFDKSTEIEELVAYCAQSACDVSPSASGTCTLRNRLGASAPAESRMG